VKALLRFRRRLGTQRVCHYTIYSRSPSLFKTVADGSGEHPAKDASSAATPDRPCLRQVDKTLRRVQKASAGGFEVTPRRKLQNWAKRSCEMWVVGARDVVVEASRGIGMLPGKSITARHRPAAIASPAIGQIELRGATPRRLARADQAVGGDPPPCGDATGLDRQLPGAEECGPFHRQWARRAGREVGAQSAHRAPRHARPRCGAVGPADVWAVVARACPRMARKKPRSTPRPSVE
jgi:hypothetical protein